MSGSLVSNNLLTLVRADLAGFGGYSSARTAKLTGDIWLNANEAAWANPGDAAGSCRRYPEPQPAALVSALADLYGARPEQLLVGRGSDEAIDPLPVLHPLPEPGKSYVKTGYDLLASSIAYFVSQFWSTPNSWLMTMHGRSDSSSGIYR